MKTYLKKNWFYFVAFIIPCLIVVVHTLIADTWLTGNGSIIKGDLSMQLIPFYYELWNRVHAGDFSDFTWTIAGGIDFSAISGYLRSPFTLLVLLVPKNWIVDTVQLIMVLKWACASLAMVYFFYNTKFNTLKEHKGAVSLFLGLGYALSNGLINFMMYIQFMDIMICLPFLLLLIEKMVDEKQWKLYCIILAFCMFSNTYIAYQICMFLVLWFFVQFTRQVENKWKSFLIFAGSSILAALINFSTILTGIVISRSRLAVADQGLKQYYLAAILIDLREYIKQNFIFTEIGRTQSVLPNVYCSIMAITLVMLFVFIKIKKSKKIYILLVTVFMLASIVLGALSFVWHLFSVPNAVYHRFINLYIFFLMFIALEVIIHLKELKMWNVLLVGFVQIGMFVYTFLNLEKYESVVIYLVTILLVVLYMMLFVLYCRKSIQYKNMLLVIVIFGILELVVNANHAFETYDYPTYDYELALDKLVQNAELDHGERIIISQTTPNLNMLSGNESVSCFASSIDGATRVLFERLGMPYNGNVEYTINGASPVINLFFNLRYGASNTEMDFSDSTVVAEDGNFKLYRMDRLAGIGYMVDEDILNWNIYEGHCFKIQNRFLHKAVGGEKVFTTVTPDIKCFNYYNIPIERNHEQETDDSYVYEYETIKGDVNDSVQAEFYVDEDMDLYMFEYSIDAQKIFVFVDGEQRTFDQVAHVQNTVHIGEVKKGQKVAVIVAEEDSSMGEPRSFLLRFAKFDDEAYQSSYEKLSSNVYEITEMTSDYIKGNIHADKPGIMMTSIQALEGFTVLVNGKESEYEVIGGAMIGVPLEKGDYTIEFVYETPIPILGKVVSGIGIIVFLIFFVLDFRKKKVTNKDEKKEDSN